MSLLTTPSGPATIAIDPERLDGLEGVRKILNALEAGRTPTLHIHKLTGASKALLISHLRRQTGRPVLVLALTDETAEAFRVDLVHFLNEPVLHFPEHPTRPYDVKQPHTDVTAARLETLAHLAEHQDGVVVTTASRYPGFSAGLITLGLHMTFHVEWILRSVNTPS